MCLDISIDTKKIQNSGYLATGPLLAPPCTAFDLAKFNILFWRLLERGMPAIVVIAFSHTKQMAWVRWGHFCCSSTFRMSNRTRQGFVASPAFWNAHLDPLFAVLLEAGFGCHVG